MVYDGYISASKYLNATMGIYVGGYGEEDIYLSNTDMLRLHDYITSLVSNVGVGGISNAGYAYFA